MRRKIQKLMKYLTLASVFFGLVIAQFVFLYAFEKRDRTSTSVHYIDPIENNIVNYEKKYTIYTPISFSGRLPTVILLHGDLVDEKSLNLLKSEFIRKGYLVVLMKIDFTYHSFLEIDAVVNQLLIHPNVDHNKIGLIGHSHGAHFAFWYAKLHDDVIQGVIMANMGSFKQLYDDYYEYYNYFVNTTVDLSYRDYLSTFTEAITVDDPRNLLIITDTYEPIRVTDLSDANFVAWEFPQQNVMYGDFQNGTARELNTQYKMFLHGSGLYNPPTIGKNIHWMNQALDISSDPVGLLSIYIIIYGYFTLVIGMIVLGVFLLYYTLKLIPVQMSWIKNKLYLKRKERKQNAEMEIPPVLKFESDITYEKEKFRIEKRYALEFDNIHDMSEYSRIIIIGVIGTHLFLYLLELMLGENSLYYVTQTNAGGFFSWVYDWNDTLNGILFTSPLSFQVMYFWILVVFFIRRLRIKDPRIQKLKVNLLDVPNIFLQGIEVFLVFWFFGYATIYHWLGLNFIQSGLNIVLRFSVLYYMHFVIVEFVYNQSSKPDSYDRRVYIYSLLFVLLIYLPVTIPNVSIFLRVYRYAIYFIIPYLAVVASVIFISLFGKKDILSATLVNFFILLFWKYNVYYWILF